MTQLSRSTHLTLTAQWKMRLLEVFSLLYFSAVCAADDRNGVTTVASVVDPSTTMVYVPPEPTLQLQSTWQDLFQSEKVELHCSVTDSSDWTFIWFRDGQKVQDPDVSADGSVLTVSADTQSKAYSCQGHHKTNGRDTKASTPFTLQVSANKPKPIVRQHPNHEPMFPQESIKFTCAVHESSGWQYLWYHNGSEIPGANSNIYTIDSISHLHRGQYHCKAKRGKSPFFTEESETTALLVSDPPNPSLSLKTPWKNVFEKEPVSLKCEVDSDDWAITWYKNQEQIKEDLGGETFIFLDEYDSHLNISKIAHKDEGAYTCNVYLKNRKVYSGSSNAVNITVYENKPVATLSKTPAFNPMYVGETVHFTCNVDVSSDWVYNWRKDGEKLTETGQTISIQLSDAGNFSCVATRGEETSTGPSQEMQQDVLKIPDPSLTPVTKWSDVFPTESVKMSCVMDGSGWSYTWYKDKEKMQADGVVSFDVTGARLSISSASAVHDGQYECQGHLNGRTVNSRFSSGHNLKVHDKQPSVTLTQEPDYKRMFPGESVSFSCHINVSSGWEYQWYKNGIVLKGTENKYTITTVGTADQGSYKCKVKRGTDPFILTYTSQEIKLEVATEKPKPLMTQTPDVAKLYTGESLSFNCEVKGSSGWEYMWYKNKTQVSNSSTLRIDQAKPSDSGTFKCMAVRKKTMCKSEDSEQRSLLIVDIPVPSLKLDTPWKDVFPTEKAILSCAMDGSSDWIYTWYKDGDKVQANQFVSFDSDAAILSIQSASAAQHGLYTCSGKLKSRSVHSSRSSGLPLHVHATKPKITLIQKPAHSVMHTGDMVSFICHVNVSDGWEYMWYKNNILLAKSGDNLTIASVVMGSTGSYKCQTKRGSKAVFLSDLSEDLKINIKERPKASIEVLTYWSEVFSTDSLVLQCGVMDSSDSWNYTWFKEDKKVDTFSERHTVTPTNDPAQSQYTCQGVRNGRPSYSKTSDHLTTKNLLLKRRVLLSISGCILFGIIAVLFGCVVLRFTRKPAAAEYKPEEAELFTRMEQKNFDDAPCPLVEYITDAALNATPKEGDENGTICSEATPLPITHEDQVVTTENHDETDNNGGLVSFKQ